jgi:hypothetical protein
MIMRRCAGASMFVLLASLCAALVGSVAPAVAATGDQRALLLRYQPVTVLDVNESFAPTTVDSFAADANLETQTAPNTWMLVNSSPLVTDLPRVPTPVCVAQSLAPCYRLNQRDCSPAIGVASLACYQADWLDPSPQSAVYGRALTIRQTTVLQYWYFYYDDFYSYNYPPDDLFWQTHEGDWEVITVLLHNDAPRPSWVGYSQHCTGERRRWGDVPRWRDTTHPLVYVGIGSHANYFGPGNHPIAVQCIPPQAIAILEQQGLPLPVDYSHPGIAYGPREIRAVTPTRVVDVTAKSPEWMRFIGTWGEYQYFHAPSPINTVIAGFSPPSPPQSGTWQHPISTILSWPRTG